MFRNLFLSLLLLATLTLQAQPKTDILLLGSDHLSQVYKPGNPATDALEPRNRRSLQAFANRAGRDRPDAVLVEALPEEQRRIDSLYALFLAGRLDLKSLPDGRSEIFTIAFPIARAASVEQVVCINAPGATSQGILDNGDGIGLYKAETQQLRAFVSELYGKLGNGSLSFDDFLRTLNRPESFNRIYHLRYYTPARVRNGSFKNPDAAVDTPFIDKRYIGAELTSIFRNRDYKIYSNIVAATMNTKAQKVLVLIGVAHIGSLRSIFRDDPEFRLVDIPASR